VKNLTLKQLREAIHTVKTSKKFARHADKVGTELDFTEAFLLGEKLIAKDGREVMPRDPREVLTEIGYKW